MEKSKAIVVVVVLSAVISIYDIAIIRAHNNKPTYDLTKYCFATQEYVGNYLQ